MNLQSGKFCAPMLGKLFERSRGHARPRQICKDINLQLHELSERKIERVEAFPIGISEGTGIGRSRGQAGNWSRSKFPALKIETVENGSIRQ